MQSEWFENSSKLFAKELKILIDSEIGIEIHQKIAQTIFNDFNWNSIALNLKHKIGLM